MEKTTRCIGIGLAVIVLFFAAGTALAHQSPAGCSANRLAVDLSRDVSLITSGTVVHYRVDIANPGSVSTGACDVTDLDIVFTCPAADGTATGTATTLTLVGNYPADGTGTPTCYSSGLGTGEAADGCSHNAGLACTVTVNAGVLTAVASVQAGGALRSQGALHDIGAEGCTPGPGCEDPLSVSKDITVTIVPCLVNADCNDNQFCTDDACVSNVCQHTAHTCAADSNFCTTESCDSNANAGAGACVSSAPKNCDDNNICTDDSCVEATGDCSNVFDVANDPSCAPSPGRMTGGGSVFTSTNRSSKTEGRVTHGFELHCDAEVGPNNLEVNWGGNHFHMEELLTAVCTDDPAIEPPPPPVGFDTYDGTGTGRCNGEPGASITFQFTDAGEPGTGDHATINITGCPGGLSLSVSGFLKKGNHQAHRTN